MSLSRTIVVLSLLVVATTHADDPPNIVMIISDDQAWNDYSFMGHEIIQTPNLDRLARESTLFRRGYVPTGLCRPSLMTLLTGHYASTHGVTGNDPSPKYSPRKSQRMKLQRAKLISFRDRFSTLPELLAQQGYLSHQSGKLWEGSYANCGFTHGMTRGFPNPGGRHGDAGLSIGRDGLKPIADFVEMATEADKPFFVWYAPFLPHQPHNPPAEILANYKSPDLPLPVAKYYAMCDWFDQTCGELLEIIDNHGAGENTFVVYVTDNGWIQDPNQNRYAPRSKQTPYEGGVRTPILFRWPDKIPKTDREELISSIDLVPTILAAAGVEAPNDLPGLNLLPMLTSKQPIDRKRIFGESFAHDIADLDNPQASLLYRWVIDGRWKLLLTYDGEVNRYASTHPRSERRPQLFDLITDPAETNNLAGQHPELLARLVKALDDWYPVTQRQTIKVFE